MPLTKLRKTPGVYVEEISLFPPSIAPVETAIPAFIGYTEKARKKERDLTEKPTRITSLLEFEQYFGKAKEEEFKFDVDMNTTTKTVSVSTVSAPELKYHLYYAMQMFFANGGGPCYIVSVGDFDSSTSSPDLKSQLTKGVNAVEKIDEVTLFVIPDAAQLDDVVYGALMNDCLKQCAKLQDRFTIIDVPNASSEEHDTDKITDFRDGISSNLEETKYGACYYPFLETILNFNAPDSAVVIRNYTENGGDIADSAVEKTAVETAVQELKTANETLSTREEELATALAAKEKAEQVKAVIDALPNTTDQDAAQEAINNLYATASEIPDDVANALADPYALVDLKTAANTVLTTTNNNVGAAKTARDVAKGDVDAKQTACDDAVKALVDKGDISSVPINKIEASHSLVYNAIKEKIAEEGRVTLPPSSTVAGIYAAVDSSRGVWKAPANVSLSYVIRPTMKITDGDQEDLNVDVTAGKSINAIRAFTGKGTLVWGARTLAGNDNEWRYVSVRRFFNFVEESVKKASSRFVFEPNSKNTWVKVKSMIENFLIVQWRAGALVGAKPEDAFYVKVGLNETMTAEDVLNGYMVVEIGMAVVRPAEFIILQFSHKMQES